MRNRIGYHRCWETRSQLHLRPGAGCAPFSEPWCRERVRTSCRNDRDGGAHRSRDLPRRFVETRERYLARKICWALTIEGLPAYVLFARHRGDLEALVEAIRPVPKPMDVDVSIGEKGPLPPAEMCAGLQVPMVAFDHAFSFDRDSMIKSIPRPESIPEKDDPKFRSAAGELFDRIMQVAD